MEITPSYLSFLSFSRLFSSLGRLHEKVHGTHFKETHLIARHLLLWNLLRKYIKCVPTQCDL